MNSATRLESRLRCEHRMCPRAKKQEAINLCEAFWGQVPISVLATESTLHRLALNSPVMRQQKILEQAKQRTAQATVHLLFQETCSALS